MKDEVAGVEVACEGRGVLPMVVVEEGSWTRERMEVRTGMVSRFEAESASGRFGRGLGVEEGVAEDGIAGDAIVRLLCD